jgi:hypothetical protein
MDVMMLLSFGVPVLITIVVLAVVLPRVFGALRGPKFKGAPVMGRAQILALRPSGGSIQRGGMPPAYSCQIALRVQLPGQPTYDVTTSQYVDSMLLPSMQPGTAVVVQVDSANPQTVRIDFSQGMAAPSSGAQASTADVAGAVNQSPGLVPVSSAAALLASGQQVRGVLKSYADTGNTPRSLGRTPSVPEWIDAPQYVIDVELQFPNMAPVEARTIQPIPLTQVPNLFVGLQVNCAVNPANPAREFVVDWGQSAH